MQKSDRPRLYQGGFPFLSRSASPRKGTARSLRTRLLRVLLPLVVLILLVSGYVGYRVSCQYIDIALDRNVRVQTKAVAHHLSSFLDACRKDLLYIAQDAGDPEALRDFLARKTAAGGVGYRELAYLSPDDTGHTLFVVEDGEVFQVPDGRLGAVQPDPFAVFTEAQGLAPGEVLLTQVLYAEHPSPVPGNASRRVAAHVVRLATPVDPDGDGRPGYVVLGVDVRFLRDILSLYNSPRSPLWAFPRSDEVRFTYVFDPEGWMLFQSEDVERGSQALSTYLPRAGMDGTLGRPGLDVAFRPDTANAEYWLAVNAVREGQAGLLHVGGGRSSGSRTYSLAYAPVYFTPAPGRERQVYWGLIFMDRSKLTLAAGFKHLDALFVITLAAIALMWIGIFLATRIVTRPIVRLSNMVAEFRSTGRMRRIDLGPAGYETALLAGAINGMIDIISQQAEELRLRERSLRGYTMKERADIESETAPGAPELEIIPEIVGCGPKIARFKSDILKAAQADVDVLIIGETGTGKQLAAEAVHAHGGRAGQPIISINCGALDENLLLDTLFGHVKGAFTDSRADRKGAFVEAHGGTLFLDEIQAASPKVQQALLRAIAERKVKPLGSDREIEVDVRLIAATNADLPALIREGRFREDLYFRLKVITVYSPPLREHPESIPALTLHYLRQVEQMVGRRGLGLSRGAMEKLRGYHWPGNIRELVNAITRAAVMAETELIQAGDIRLEQEIVPEAEDAALAEAEEAVFVFDDLDDPRPAPEPGQAGPTASAPRDPAPPAPRRDAGPARDAASRLNERQRRAYPEILRRGEVSRQGYQDLVGGDLPSRTAIYDLQDMVKKGLLVKTGRGPATRYLVER
ncbi:sigma-54-dependent transcriptional regulator [Desulfocurvus vexinensis]|uniref:sigma-54-dependent transcriptional regulator n=1 Tax=Desulfocurvus vexinensis TaxID=399548 RepID=UPI0004ADB9AC|nr:sigma-54 dependent transcriptional regulator [Desulfocurvus vexinensis]